MTQNPKLDYRNKKVLITGGLGFIGRNLAAKLSPLGAKVTLLAHDSPYFEEKVLALGNLKGALRIVQGDLLDQRLLQKLVADENVIFNLAGKTNHATSGPFEDLEANVKTHLVLLESCRISKSKAKIVFASSRMVYGKMIQKPFTEEHPTNPINFYGIHKLTAEKYHLLYERNFGVRSTILRITNCYGGNAETTHSMPDFFMQRALGGKSLIVHGNGMQLRDYIHIDDLCEALLLVGQSEKANGEVYNCGSGKAVVFKEMAELVVKTAGKGKIEYIERPKNYEGSETGDFETDLSKLEALGWKPKIPLAKGLAMMCEFYKNEKTTKIRLQ